VIFEQVPDFPSNTPREGSWSGARDTKGEVEALRFDVERLLLITEALWSILKEKTDLKDEELIRRIAEIDQADGKLDGRKAKAPPRPCPHCQRVLAKHRPRCLFCGKPVETTPFER
jgi:ribosomal protein S27AE